MKISVSLSDEDILILDEFARSAGLPSRAPALHRAVHMLRLPELEHDYEAAWADWEASGDQAEWDATAADRLARAAG